MSNSKESTSDKLLGGCLMFLIIGGLIAGLIALVECFTTSDVKLKRVGGAWLAGIGSS